MTRYSDFVKRYMKENGKNWNCAVCDIKKGDLYNDFKKGENKQIKSDMEMMGAEDIDAPAKKIIIKRKRLRIVGQKKVKTLEPSPIPPPMALEPADPNMRTNMALGSMPELLGAMIQDFIRPTEDTLIRKRQDLQLERNALLALLYAIRGRSHFKETERFYQREYNYSERRYVNKKERKLTAYLKKIDAFIKKAKKKATIDESEVNDYFYWMAIDFEEGYPRKKDREPEDEDRIVGAEYLKKHDFYLGRYKIFEYYYYMGERVETDRVDRISWKVYYKKQDTRDLLNELTEMVKELK